MNTIDRAFEQKLAAEKREAAEHVLGVFDGGYPQPGSFTTSLLNSFALADLTNRANLTAGFPVLGHAFELWKTGGPEAVKEWGGLK